MTDVDASAPAISDAVDVVDTSDAIHKPGTAGRTRWLTRERIVLYSAALLLSQTALIGIWAVACWGLHARGVPLPGSDFRVFWCTSRVSLGDGAAAAFDQQRLSACEAALHAGMPTGNTFGPWIYPPTFHLFVYPLALLPYAISYALFMSIGVAGCLIACIPAMKRNPLPWVSAAAFPGIWVAMACGQNSLLTPGLAAAALGLLESFPIWAGVCAGLLVIKPQLAILFPLFFLCGRHHRACAATVLTAVLFCAASGLLAGWSLWTRFFQTAAWFRDAVLEHGDGGLWHAMPTLFAFSRQLGAGIGVAYALHAGVAITAVAGTAVVWARRSNPDLRAAAAVLCTLLVQPYLVYYDLAWLLLPIIHVCRHASTRHGPERQKRIEYVVATLAWLTPLVSFMQVFRASSAQWAAFLPLAWLGLILVQAFRYDARHSARAQDAAA